MNDNGRIFLESVGSLLTHAWLDDYGFSKREKEKINKAIHLLIEVKTECDLDENFRKK